MENKQTSVNINKDVLIKGLNLNQDRNTVFFENDKIIVLSPSVQSDSWWFDLLIGNVEKVRASKKKGLLILRFLNELLVTELESFVEKMISEDTVVTRENGQPNWKFNIKKIQDKYIVINNQNTKVEYPVEKVSESELIYIANGISGEKQ